MILIILDFWAISFLNSFRKIWTCFPHLWWRVCWFTSALCWTFTFWLSFELLFWKLKTSFISTFSFAFSLNWWFYHYPLLFGQVILLMVSHIASATRNSFDDIARLPLGLERESVVTHLRSFEQNSPCINKEFVTHWCCSWRLTHNFEIFEIVELNGLDNFSLGMGHNNQYAVKWKGWITVINDFVRPSQVLVGFQHGLARWLCHNASGGNTITQNALLTSAAPAVMRLNYRFDAWANSQCVWLHCLTIFPNAINNQKNIWAFERSFALKSDGLVLRDFWIVVIELVVITVWHTFIKPDKRKRKPGWITLIEILLCQSNRDIRRYPSSLTL